jgi:RNA polymerase sigma-70 factor (ECF subfamily)
MSAEPPSGPGAGIDELAALVPHLRAFAQSLCRDRSRADDLAQDTLTRAWRHRADYTPGTNLKAWLFTILRNQYYSDHRRAWRETQLDPDEAARTLIAVTNPIASLELDDVRRAMVALPDEQREALTLVGVAGLSYEDAAGICACAVGTIKSRVNRARRRLQAILSLEHLADQSRVDGGVMASMVAAAELLRASRASASGLAQATLSAPSETDPDHGQLTELGPCPSYS